MKSLACMLFILLFSTQAYATEPFVMACENKEKAHRYDIDNGLDMSGGKIPDPRHGWTTEIKWWGKDMIAWSGGEELLLSHGRLNAKVVRSDNDVLMAIYTDVNNVYVITFDVNLGILLLSQQQTVVTGEHRALKARTAVLECQRQFYGAAQ